MKHITIFVVCSWHALPGSAQTDELGINSKNGADTLAPGAKGVGIGRPFLWGLGAFGQAGVDRVLEILQGELKLVTGRSSNYRVTGSEGGT